MGKKTIGASNGQKKESLNHIKSVEKAFRIFDVFLQKEGEISVSEMARRCGMSQSTAYRIMTTMKSVNFLVENPQTGLYRLGLAFLPLSNQVLNQNHLCRIARAELPSLAEETGFNANMAVMHYGAVLYVARMDAPGSRYSHALLGKLAPLHCTSLGKALLLDMSRQELIDLLETLGMPQYTENTVQSSNELYQEIQTARRQGYTFDNSEYNHDACCIGATIRGEDGRIVASISASSKRAVFLGREKEDIVKAVIHCANKISSALGYGNSFI
jgi:DNA-binding IclR family transcriptional regulator